jgi:hypothetical protein
MAEQALNQSSSLLFQLPPEIRHYIWELTLPVRVVELDVPLNHIVRTSCQLQTTTWLNARAPLATRICHESRAVALGNGGPLYSDDEGGTRGPAWAAGNPIAFNPWARPATDVLHINWTSAYDTGFALYTGAIALLHSKAQQQGMRMSIMSSLILGFNTFGQSFTFGASQALALLRSDTTYLVTLHVVSLHVGLDVALKTGLFGRLCEERVRLVGAGDKATFQAFSDLWDAGPPDDEEPEAFFGLALRRHESDWLARIVAWRKAVEIRWLKHRWDSAGDAGFPGIVDPWDAWLLPSGDDESAQQSLHLTVFEPPGLALLAGRVPNKEHPWVVKEMLKIPRFEPQVMFRLCEEMCYAPPPLRQTSVRGSGVRGIGRGGLQ